MQEENQPAPVPLTQVQPAQQSPGAAVPVTQSEPTEETKQETPKPVESPEETLPPLKPKEPAASKKKRK